jgi:hypothetical protein
MDKVFDFEASFAGLVKLIRDQEVVNWVVDKVAQPTPENLVYLAKFAYMTGLINKAGLKTYLGVDGIEAKRLVRRWYDDHRRRGCGTC